MAEKLQARELLQSVHFGMGAVLFYLGELPQALTHLELAMTLYDPERRRLPASEDPGVGSLALQPSACGHSEDPSIRLVTEFKSLSSWPRNSLTPSVSVLLWNVRPCSLSAAGRQQQLKSRPKGAIALADDQGFVLRKAVGLTLRGWALAKGGGKKGLPRFVRVLPRPKVPASFPLIMAPKFARYASGGFR